VTALSLMDLGFVITETSASPKHVAGLMVFDLPESSDDELVGKMVDELRKAPVRAPFNRILKSGRFGLPEWERVSNVDTAHHIRHLRLPRPGTEAQLMDLIEQLHAPLLDRRRPLWEMHIIEGLENNRFAMYSKIHHAYADGITFSRWIVDSLSKSADDQDTTPPWAIQHLPDTGTSDEPVNPLELLRQLGRGALTAAELGTMTLRHGLQLAGAYDSQVPVPFAAPRTPFNGSPTSDRAITVLSMDLQELRDLARSLAASINDVVLTLVDMGLGDYLRKHKMSTGKPLVAEMPVNLRRDSAAEKSGNQISILLLELGDPKAAPLEKLRQIHRSSRQVQRQFAALSEQTVTTYSLSTQIAASIGEIMNLNEQAPPLGNVVVSNVPGPAMSLYFRGARLRGVFPISVLAPNVALNITVYSYAGRLCFGLVAGKRQIPDLADLTSYIKNSLEVLKYSAMEEAAHPRAPETSPAPAAPVPAVKKPPLVRKRAGPTALEKKAARPPQKRKVRTRKKVEPVGDETAAEESGSTKKVPGSSPARPQRKRPAIRKPAVTPAGETPAVAAAPADETKAG
jgi:diacylglycerol O-acyltransferase